MRKLKQTGIALVLAMLLATGTDISAFGAVVAASSFGSSSDARLPACCRRHGKGHCPMMQGTGTASAQTQAMQTQAMQIQAMMATDTRHPSIHAPCDCPSAAPQAVTSDTAWMPFGSLLLMPARVEARLSARGRCEAPSVERWPWRDRGPPETNTQA